MHANASAGRCDTSSATRFGASVTIWNSARGGTASKARWRRENLQEAVQDLGQSQRIKERTSQWMPRGSARCLAAFVVVRTCRGSAPGLPSCLVPYHKQQCAGVKGVGMEAISRPGGSFQLPCAHAGQCAHAKQWVPSGPRMMSHGAHAGSRWPPARVWNNLAACTGLEQLEGLGMSRGTSHEIALAHHWWLMLGRCLQGRQQCLPSLRLGGPQH